MLNHFSLLIITTLLFVVSFALSDRLQVLPFGQVDGLFASNTTTYFIPISSGNTSPQTETGTVNVCRECAGSETVCIDAALDRVNPLPPPPTAGACVLNDTTGTFASSKEFTYAEAPLEYTLLPLSRLAGTVTSTKTPVFAAGAFEFTILATRSSIPVTTNLDVIIVCNNVADHNLLTTGVSASFRTPPGTCIFSLQDSAQLNGHTTVNFLDIPKFTEFILTTPSYQQFGFPVPFMPSFATSAPVTQVVFSASVTCTANSNVVASGTSEPVVLPFDSFNDHVHEVLDFQTLWAPFATTVTALAATTTCTLNVGVAVDLGADFEPEFTTIERPFVLSVWPSLGTANPSTAGQVAVFPTLTPGEVVVYPMRYTTATDETSLQRGSLARSIDGADLKHVFQAVTYTETEPNVVYNRVKSQVVFGGTWSSLYNVSGVVMPTDDYTAQSVNMLVHATKTGIYKIWLASSTGGHRAVMQVEGDNRLGGNWGDNCGGANCCSASTAPDEVFSSSVKPVYMVAGQTYRLHARFQMGCSGVGKGLDVRIFASDITNDTNPIEIGSIYINSVNFNTNPTVHAESTTASYPDWTGTLMTGLPADGGYHMVSRATEHMSDGVDMQMISNMSNGIMTRQPVPPAPAPTTLNSLHANVEAAGHGFAVIAPVVTSLAGELVAAPAQVTVEGNGCTEGTTELVSGVPTFIKVADHATLTSTITCHLTLTTTVGLPTTIYSTSVQVAPAPTPSKLPRSVLLLRTSQMTVEVTAPAFLSVGDATQLQPDDFSADYYVECANSAGIVRGPEKSGYSMAATLVTIPQLTTNALCTVRASVFNSFGGILETPSSTSWQVLATGAAKGWYFANGTPQTFDELPIICNPGYFCEGGNVLAQPCPEGTYQSFEGQFECLKCRPGSYSDVKAATTCTVCSPPLFTTSVTEACVTCPLGSGVVVDGNAGVDCKVCEAGQFSSGLSGFICMNCPAGSVAATAGLTACTPCGNGSYTDGASQTTCHACPAKTYYAGTGGASIDACLSCAGADQHVSGDRSQCITCEAGRVPNSDGTACVACGPGEAELTDGTCTACANNTYSLGGVATCTDCPANTHATANHDGCLPDPGYYFSNLTDFSTTTQCEAGYKCDGTTVSKVACTGADYQSEQGMTQCKICKAGSYTTATDGANTACTTCEAGYACNGTNTKTECTGANYSHAGADKCTPCDVGHYVTSDGTVNTDCTICAAGTYGQVAGLTECVTCPSGSACPGDGFKHACNADNYEYQDKASQTVCKTCSSPPHRPYLFQHSSTTCSYCPLLTYINHGVCEACANVEDGLKCVAVVDDQGVTFNLRSDLSCPQYSGYDFATSSCVASAGAEKVDDKTYKLCDEGFAKNTKGDYACTQCAAGTYASIIIDNEVIGAAAGATTCTACPAASYQPMAGQTTCKTCSITNYTVDAELANVLLSATDCLPCPAGHACPDGAVISTCTGTQYAAALSPTCSICLSGSFVTTVDGVNTACSPCPAGHYCANGATATECPTGTHPDTSYTTCVTKPGYYTVGGGAWTSIKTVAPCDAGWKCPGGSADPSMCAGMTYQPLDKQAYCLPCTAALSYLVAQPPRGCGYCGEGQYMLRGQCMACSRLESPYYCEEVSTSPDSTGQTTVRVHKACTTDGYWLNEDKECGLCEVDYTCVGGVRKFNLRVTLNLSTRSGRIWMAIIVGCSLLALLIGGCLYGWWRYNGGKFTRHSRCIAAVTTVPAYRILI